MEALLLIDIQNDFVPGGALAVRDGHAVVPVANALMPRFNLVVATQDWHPPDHESFASQHPGRRPGEVIDLHGLPQVLWPDHCVKNTHGAELVRELDCSRIDEVVQKGADREIDSYSGFFDNGHRKDTGLHAFLRSQGIEALYLVGIATDYCVKFTALDARELGYRVKLVIDGVRGVGLKPTDIQDAIDEMQKAGVEVVESSAVKVD